MHIYLFPHILMCMYVRANRLHIKVMETELRRLKAEVTTLLADLKSTEGCIEDLQVLDFAQHKSCFLFELCVGMLPAIWSNLTMTKMVTSRAFT